MFIGLAIIALFLQTIFAKKFKEKQKMSELYVNATRFTGEEVVRSIFQSKGITSIKLTEGKKEQNHYNPQSDTVVLAPEVYRDNSVADVAIAAHEASHSLQDSFFDFIRPFRIFFVLSAMLAFVLSIPTGIIGFLFGSYFTLLFAHWSIVYCLGVFSFFSFLNLFTEADASLKALKFLKDLQLISIKERKQARHVLTLAYGTYVFSFLFTACLLLHFF